MPNSLRNILIVKATARRPLKPTPEVLNRMRRVATQGTDPKPNRVWWREKIAANRKLDRRKADQLRRINYRVVTLWERDGDERVRNRLSAAPHLSQTTLTWT